MVVPALLSTNRVRPHRYREQGVVTSALSAVDSIDVGYRVLSLLLSALSHRCWLQGDVSFSFHKVVRNLIILYCCYRIIICAIKAFINSIENCYQNIKIWNM